MRRDYLSWGKIFRYSHDVHILRWSDDNISQILSQCRNVLPFGNGRSYGDVCLNANGLLLDVSHLNSFISFDKESGVLTCEAGVTIGEIIKLTVPYSWFPPVVPGTKHVTIGGAIANDIHGKNHISKGSFGCWVKRFELIKSDGSSYICSPESNRELFAATIGGMGLTGYIKWAEIQLIQGGPLIEVETKKFENFEELLRINEESRSKYEYTVAWMDLTSKGDALGRGVYIAGKHLLYPFNAHKNLTDRHRLTLP